MAAGGDEDVFATLRSAATPTSIAAQKSAQEAREKELYAIAQQRVVSTIKDHSSQPVYFDTITINGAVKTRNSFLKSIVQPAIEKSDAGNLTLAEAFTELQKTVNGLHHFGIFHPTIPLHVDTPPTHDPSTSSRNPSAPIPLVATINVKERSRIFLKSGTDLGNSEGTAYAQATLRNLFGGAESLNVTGSAGTRTRSAYDATFTAPLNDSQLAEYSIKALKTSRDNTSFASHTEEARGIQATIRWLNPLWGLQQSVSYDGLWRTLDATGEKASHAVRMDAGDSVISSLSHILTRDTRNSSTLATSGSLFRFKNSLAGVGGLGGSIGHWKTEAEGFVAQTLFKGVSVSGSLRGGLLYPLALSGAEGNIKPSTISDRFHIGGSNDVRGFQTGGLGPHSGNDSLGGDAYVAGCLGLMLPFPKVGADSGLRLQAFVNGGRVLALQPPPGVNADTPGEAVRKGVGYTLGRLVGEMPSLSAGVGIVYGHPVARFEFNFCLPIGMRGAYGEEGAERARKGLQFGVGVEFL